VLLFNFHDDKLFIFYAYDCMYIFTITSYFIDVSFSTKTSP